MEYTETIIQGDCAGNFTIFRNWKATDGSDNFTNHDQIIHVIDTIGPDFGHTATHVSINCDDINYPFGPYGLDNYLRFPSTKMDTLRAPCLWPSRTPWVRTSTSTTTATKTMLELFDCSTCP